MADIIGKIGGLTRREQQTGPGEYADQVYTTDARGAAVANGTFYLAGSGLQTLAAAGNIRITVGNPSGSGVNVFLARLVIYSDTASRAQIWANPATGLPATLRTTTNAIIGQAAAKALVNADTSTTTALSGGTDTGLLIPFAANTRESIDLPPLVLAPGVTLGVNIAMAAVSSNTVLSVYWFEE